MKRFIRILCFIIAFAMLAAVPGRPACAKMPLKGMILIHSGKVQSILNANMVMLEDAYRFKLENVRIPIYEDQKAMDEMNKMFLGKEVDVYAYPPSQGQTQTATDSSGVPLAQVVRTKDGLWAQQDLVSKGLAWAYPSGAGNVLLPGLQKVEARARQRQKGFWASYRVKTPYNAKKYVGTYQLVQGRVVSVSFGKKGDVVFFNFSKDWQHGFSIILPGAFTKWYPKGSAGYVKNNNSGLWHGRVLLVRGQIENEGGKPLIKVTSEDQLHVVEKIRK